MLCSIKSEFQILFCNISSFCSFVITFIQYYQILCSTFYLVYFPLCISKLLLKFPHLTNSVTFGKIQNSIDTDVPLKYTFLDYKLFKLKLSSPTNKK